MGRGTFYLGIGALATSLAVLAVVLSGLGEGDGTPFVASEESADEVVLQRPNSPHVEAVVTAHELATGAGRDILARGGSAADAAVAVAAVLSVVEPWFSSVLGGGVWALYFDGANQEVTSLDGVGPTGSKASIEDFSQRASEGGIHQSNVPGAWDGWMLWLDRYGRLDLGEVLLPAITIARDGYPVSSAMASWLERSAISARPDTAAIYAPGGVLLNEGDTVYQRDMADTFEALIDAYDGALPQGRTAAIQAARDYYYRGPLAEAIVEFSDENGGYLTREDFAGFEAEIVEPISINWDDETTVFQNPPNSQGITMLIALNILKEFDFSGMDMHDAEAIHAQVEALKLAFADRHYNVGDPDRIDVPVEELLSDEHAAELRDRVDQERAMTWPVDNAREQWPEPTEPVAGTTTFHIIDRDGNAAAVTTSLGAQFLVAGDTGIHMNNRMRFLSLEEGNPNQLEPGFKVRHTSNPYMVFRGGQLYILGGNTGVDTQVQAQLQQFINIVVFGQGAQEAVSAPRFVSSAFPATTYPYDVPNALTLENGFPDGLREELEDLGHKFDGAGDTFGTGGVIVVEPGGQSAEAGADEERNDEASGHVSPP